MTLLAGGGSLGFWGARLFWPPKSSPPSPSSLVCLPIPISKPLVPTPPSPQLVCKCLGVQCHDGPIVLPLGVSPHIPAPQFSCGALNRHSHGVSLPPIRLICLLLLPPGEFGGWPQSDSFGRDGCQCVGGHHCLGEEWGRAENPPNSCLKSGPTLAGVWTENSPPHFGGVLLPSLPSSSDCPPEFRVGVLVTANVCMGLAGRWGFSPLSRAVEPRELSSP